MSSEERRASIVQAALPLFAEFGFAAVKTKMIAQVAGISEALLYRHFGDKEELYRAIQDQCVAHATEPVETLNRLPDNTATLVLCAHALIWKVQQGPRSSCKRHQQIRRLIVRSLLDDGEFASLFIERTSSIWIDKMRRCIGASIASSDVVSEHDDVELGIWLAHHFSAMVALYKLPEKKIIEYPGDDSKMLERSVRYCLRGIGMTPNAIKTHYHPEQLELLLEENAA